MNIIGKFPVCAFTIPRKRKRFLGIPLWFERRPPRDFTLSLSRAFGGSTAWQAEGIWQYNGKSISERVWRFEVSTYTVELLAAFVTVYLKRIGEIEVYFAVVGEHWQIRTGN